MMFRRRSLTPAAANSNSRKIFDEFLNFAKSDMWKLPIFQFIEQYSIIFDSFTECDQNSFRRCHAEFSGLVDDLLDAYCKDSRVNKENLLASISSREFIQGLSVQEKELLEPVFAHDSYDMFFTIMMRKNIELQLQALRVLQHLIGRVPSALMLGAEEEKIWKELPEDEDESERLILISILRQSLNDWEKDEHLQTELLNQLEAALRDSLQIHQKFTENIGTGSIHAKGDASRNQLVGQQFYGNIISSSNTNPPALVTEQNVSNKKAKNDKPPTRKDQIELQINDSKKGEANKVNRSPKELCEEKAPTASKVEEANTTKKADQEKSEAAEQKNKKLDDVKNPFQKRDTIKIDETSEINNNFGGFGYKALLKDREQIPEEVLRERMKYLREQRDKLVFKKAQEREKRLNALVKSEVERPHTAKAAAKALGLGQHNTTTEDHKQIAKRLKSEVIDSVNKKNQL